MASQLRERHESAYSKVRAAHTNGTYIYNLTSKPYKNSGTGVRGVCQVHSGKYRAYLTVGGKRIVLGSFGSIEEAKKSRSAAEQKYHVPLVEDYKKNNGL